MTTRTIASLVLIGIFAGGTIAVFYSQGMLGDTHEHEEHDDHDHDEHEADHDDDHAEKHGHGHDEEDFDRGPNGGRMLVDDHFEVEVTIFESGMPAEFRIFAYDDETPVDPTELEAEISLHRLGGRIDRFSFEPEDDYLLGSGEVSEPHSFDVDVSVSYRGETYDWHFDSHEGRTRIPARVAEAQQIRVGTAGPAELQEFLPLTGTVQTNPAGISEVRARFPGIVTAVAATIGDTVEAGDALVTIETNESLREVVVRAPIAGLIVDRNVQAGQVTADAPLFVIADHSELWVYLDVFGAGLGSVAVGQPVTLRTLNGNEFSNSIDWVSPLVAHGSQSVRARVTVHNPEGALRPGQFVRASVMTDSYQVPLAVRREALQTFEGEDVVFARIDEDYEVRMLELGRRDAQWVEVLGGIEPGEEYVTGNSYLIKADIEKAGASHDH